MKKIKTSINIKVTNRVLLAICLATLGLAFAVTVLPAQIAYAEPPTTVTVVCKDGTSQTATRAGLTFTTADYDKACAAHVGYVSPAGSAGTQTVPEISNINAGACNEDQVLKYSSDGSTSCVAAPNKHECGSGVNGGKIVTVSFDFGCKGTTYTKPLNPLNSCFSRLRISP